MVDKAFSGKVSARPSESESVNFKLTKPDGTIQPLSGAENSDGSYYITFIVSAAGKYSLVASVNQFTSTADQKIYEAATSIPVEFEVKSDDNLPVITRTITLVLVN